MAFGESLLTAEERKLLIKLVDKDYGGERISRFALELRNASTDWTAPKFRALYAKDMLRNAGIEETNSKYPDYYKLIIAQLEGIS